MQPVASVNLENAWTLISGKRGFLLDGVDDYVSAGIEDVWKFGAGKFTLSMWIFPTSFAAEFAIYDTLALSGAYQRTTSFVLVGTATTGKLRVYTSFAYSASTTAGLVINQWNHIAIVRTSTSANGAQFFVNGIPDITVTIAASITSGGAVIGRYSDGPGGWLAGAFSDVMLLSQAATRRHIDVLKTRPGIAYERAPRKFYSLPAAAATGNPNGILQLNTQSMRFGL